MNCFFLISLFVSSAVGAPQFLVQQPREPVVRIVARPRAVAHHIAPAAGPFTIRAEQPVLVSQASEIPIPATPALVPATRTSLLPAVSGPALLPVNAEPSVFQTADGRVFAFSNGVNAIQPGQLFQLADGRIFTASLGNQEVKQESLFDQAEQNDAVIEALRTAERTAAEDNSSTSSPDTDPAPEDKLEDVLEEAAVQEEEMKEEVKEEPTVLRTTQAVIPAPVPQFIGAQPFFGSFPGVQRLAAPAPLVAAAPARAQAVAVQRTPTAFSFSDAVSTQYFNYPNFGIAYEF